MGVKVKKILHNVTQDVTEALSRYDKEQGEILKNLWFDTAIQIQYNHPDNITAQLQPEGGRTKTSF